MRKIVFILILIALGIVLLAACGNKPTPTIPSGGPYNSPTPFTQSLPIQGNEEATPEPGLANPTESPLPTPVSPLPTPTPAPAS